MKTDRKTRTKPVITQQETDADSTERTDAPWPVRPRSAAQDILAEFRQQTILKALRACPVFSGLATPDLKQLAAMSGTRWLAKGDGLFRQGEAVAGLFVVQMGAVQVSRGGTAGHEQILHIFRAGDAFAEEDLTSESGHTADARAGEESHVVVIERAGFLAFLEEQPELSLRLLRLMNEHLHRLVGLLDDLRLKDVKSRLAGWLMAHCPDPQSRVPFTIELPTTKRVLAAKLGAASETFSRTVARFRAQKLVAVHGRAITLLSPARLAQLYGAAGAPTIGLETRDPWGRCGSGLDGAMGDRRSLLAA